MEAAEDDEWEYEYDDNETEDFYITVDMSSVPKTNDKSAPSEPNQLASGYPVLLQSRLRALGNTAKGAATVTDGSADADSNPVAKMQIVDLHTPNPLIMYNDQLLQCSWASTIGTDMYFVKPSPNKDTQDAPLKSLPGVDLLALGSAKLMATGAVLEPRDELFEKKGDPTEMSAVTDPVVKPKKGVSANPTSSAASTDGEETASENSDSSETEREEILNAPTGFLAKFNEAKRKRGDKTQLFRKSGSKKKGSLTSKPFETKTTVTRSRSAKAAAKDRTMEDAS